MIDIKQLQFFVACAKTGSFSRAAQLLYTTQPNVSKVIKSLEDSMNTELFVRYTKGIRMTAAGEHVYKYARRVMENMEMLEQFEVKNEPEQLLISCNPSSWFADMFVEFYQQNKDEKVHYQIYSTSIREIIQRVQERTDDIGFLYVMKNQLSSFQYFLSRNYLEFEVMKTTDIMLYPGAGHPFWQNPADGMNLSGQKLIQCFPDEFSLDNYWYVQDENGDSAADAETVITTNSDYIMERMLKTGDLVNISGAYLTEKDETDANPAAVSLLTGEQQILFGYVKRQNEELSKWGTKFVLFLKEKLFQRE
ncbi:MAG: LysR family transcriptional regulator [Lachnospiraceae bacterium]|nr:LysR family transcriptional regulator [Lachnospiraceae bacterium]